MKKKIAHHFKIAFKLQNCPYVEWFQNQGKRRKQQENVSKVLLFRGLQKTTGRAKKHNTMYIVKVL